MLEFGFKGNNVVMCLLTGCQQDGKCGLVKDLGLVAKVRKQGKPN